MKVEVIVCDDEVELREIVADYLETRGYLVRAVGDAAGLKEALETREPDAIILDIRMPGEDGLSALRSIRAASDVPILMLTAADDVIDRVVGLEMGADDYLGKPVDPRELEARLKTVLRRRVPPPPPAAAKDEPLVPFGRCMLDVQGARLLGPDGERVAMTAMEFALLKCFAEHRGRVLSRDQLLELAHDRGWEPFDRSIDLRISRIRKKVELNPENPQAIRTVRGIGYVFDPDRMID